MYSSLGLFFVCSFTSGFIFPGLPCRFFYSLLHGFFHHFFHRGLHHLVLQDLSTVLRCDFLDGPPYRIGERVQLLIPSNTFHTARLAHAPGVERRWFLGASTEWPGVVPADVEIGNLDQLAGQYPAVAAEVRAIAASVRDIP